jgi:ketosteroid isomerase-like protein
MSQENVDTLMRAWAETRSDPDAFFQILDEEVEWEMAGGWLETAKYHGPEGVREFFRRWAGAFDEWGFEAEEVIDAGDAVVVLLHQWGRGKGSGVPVETRFWQVWTFSEGKVIRHCNYRTKEEALEAAGLSE